MFSVNAKILSIVAIFSIPIGVLAFLLASASSPQAASTELEMSGNALQKPLIGVLLGLQATQRTLETCDAANCLNPLTADANVVDRQFDAALKENADHGTDLRTNDEDLAGKKLQNLSLRSLRAEWKKLASDGKIAASAAERVLVAQNCNHLGAELRQLIGYIGDTSSLILDPERDSHYLVDVTLLAMPETIDRIASTSSLANKLAGGTGSALEQAALANESALLSRELERIATSNQISFDADVDTHGISPTLIPKLRPVQQQFQAVVAAYVATLNTIADNPAQASLAALAAQTETVSKTALEYWDVAGEELDNLLNARIDDLAAARLKAYGFSALAILLAAFTAFAVGRSITKPLQELVQNLAPRAALLRSSVERIAETNPVIGQELNEHAEKMRIAILELARHLDGGTAPRPQPIPTLPGQFNQ